MTFLPLSVVNGNAFRTFSILRRWAKCSPLRFGPLTRVLASALGGDWEGSQGMGPLSKESEADMQVDVLVVSSKGKTAYAVFYFGLGGFVVQRSSPTVFLPHRTRVRVRVAELSEKGGVLKTELLCRSIFYFSSAERYVHLNGLIFKVMSPTAFSV